MFGLSTFSALLSLTAITDDPVRAAMDHSKLSAYAAHPYISDDAVALLSTLRISTRSLRRSRTLDGSATATSCRPTAIPRRSPTRPSRAADGYVVLGFGAEGVEAAASGDAESSTTGELAGLEALDAPVVGAVVPETADEDCVELVGFEDFVDETFRFYVTVDGEADVSKLSKDLAKEAPGVGFDDQVAGRAKTTRSLSNSRVSTGAARELARPARGNESRRDRASPLRLRVSLR